MPIFKKLQVRRANVTHVTPLIRAKADEQAERTGGIGDRIADSGAEHDVYPVANSRPSHEDGAGPPSTLIEQTDYEPIEMALQESEERYRYTI